MSYCIKCGSTTKKLIHHHQKYLEIHGYDKVVMLCVSCHVKLHNNIRKENKCNYDPGELCVISLSANERLPHKKEWHKKYNEEHKEDRAVWQKKYNNDHKEQYIINNKKHSFTEKSKSTKRKYIEDNKEHLLSKRRENYYKNIDHYKLKAKEYRSHRKEKAKQYQIEYRQRKKGEIK